MPPDAARSVDGSTNSLERRSTVASHQPKAPRASVRVLPTAWAAAEAVAENIVELLARKPEAVLGLATGVTMEPVYEALVSAHRAGRASFARVTTFNLDEYVGLPQDHPQSYRMTMHRLLFDHVDVDLSRTHLPRTTGADSGAACRDYERAIADAGGIDLQLLGIGRNGHVGFNEPGSPADSRCREVVLHPSTLGANAPFFFPYPVPNRAVTVGVANIMEARSIVVLATGVAKRIAVARALVPDPGPDCPASWLQCHANARWVLDADAAPAG